MLGNILVIVLIFVLFGGSGFFPGVPRGYGYGYTGISAVGVLLIVLLVLVFTRSI